MQNQVLYTKLQALRVNYTFKCCTHSGKLCTSQGTMSQGPTSTKSRGATGLTLTSLINRKKKQIHAQRGTGTKIDHISQMALNKATHTNWFIKRNKSRRLSRTCDAPLEGGAQPSLRFVPRNSNLCIVATPENLKSSKFIMFL